MLLPFNQCPVHEGGLWAASAQRKAQHGSIVKASSPVMYSHIPSHYIPSSPQWNTITAAVQWLWKEKDIILAQYFPFYSAHAEDQALWIFFFFDTHSSKRLVRQKSWGFYWILFGKFFVLRSMFACICLDLQQVIVGEHLQQEQRGGDTAGVAVLPALGAAVPWLPAGGLQVRSGVARVADRPEPRVGWSQVNPSLQT